MGGEFAYSVLSGAGRGEAALADDLRLLEAQFLPGEVLELAATLDPGS